MTLCLFLIVFRKRATFIDALLSLIDKDNKNTREKCCFTEKAEAIFKCFGIFAPMIGIIELENMEFWAGHGCYDLEQVVGNRFLVNLRVEVGMSKAAQSDDLTESISYLTLYELVREEMAQSSRILENVAKRVLDALYRHYPEIVKATVKISKLAPPLGGKVGSASVTLSR